MDDTQWGERQLSLNKSYQGYLHQITPETLGHSEHSFKLRKQKVRKGLHTRSSNHLHDVSDGVIVVGVELSSVVLSVHDHHQMAVHIQSPAQRSSNNNDLQKFKVNKNILKYKSFNFQNDMYMQGGLIMDTQLIFGDFFAFFF